MKKHDEYPYSQYKPCFQFHQSNSSRKTTWLIPIVDGFFNVWKTDIITPEIIGTIEEVCWSLDKCVLGKFIESIPSPKGCLIPEGYKQIVVLKVTTSIGYEYHIYLKGLQVQSYLNFKSGMMKAGKDIRTVSTKMTPYWLLYQGESLTDIKFKKA